MVVGIAGVGDVGERRADRAAAGDHHAVGTSVASVSNRDVVVDGRRGVDGGPAGIFHLIGSRVGDRSDKEREEDEERPRNEPHKGVLHGFVTETFRLSATMPTPLSYNRKLKTGKENTRKTA